MIIRLSYIKRDTIGDGFCLAPEFDVDLLPRQGEFVVLPTAFCKQIERFLRGDKQLVQTVFPIRFEVLHVEHRWEGLAVPAWHVSLTSLPNPDAPFPF